MNFRFYIIVLFAGISLVFGQCTKKEIIILSDEKEILTFSLREVKVTAQWDGQTLNLVSHEPVDVSKPLTPDITVSKDAVLYPSSGTPQIFSELGVKYVVTAQSGNSKEFFVKLRVLSSDKEILSFTIPNKTTYVAYNENTIDIEVYDFVDVTNLTPIITYSSNATVSPKSGEMIDFSYPVTYTVTAQDGSTADYTVTVTKSLSRRNEIESFELIGTQQIFEREGDNLIIYVPYETDITNTKTNIVISDMATVSPENGVFVDFTNPQIYTVTASDGASKNYWVTVKRSPWRKVGNAPFSPRDEIGCLVFKDKMWVMGGWQREDPPYHSGEIWNTSDGVNWQRVVENAPWRTQITPRFVVFRDSIWAINGGWYLNEIWRSGDGISWEKVQNEVPWGWRHNPYVGVFKNKIWLMGGHDLNYKVDRTAVFNDIWSSDDGINWTLEKDHAEWSPRGLIYGFVTINDNMYLYGGGIYTVDLYQTFNDVWVSSNGFKWNIVVKSAEWSRRGFSTITEHNNKLWILGGGSPEMGRISNEVWYSETEGKTWKQIKYTFFSATHANGFISFKGKLWMVAGWYHNEVWVFEE